MAVKFPRNQWVYEYDINQYWWTYGTITFQAVGWGCLIYLLCRVWHRHASHEAFVGCTYYMGLTHWGGNKMPLASFTKEVNPLLAKRPLVFNGRLANLGSTSFVKGATVLGTTLSNTFYFVEILPECAVESALVQVIAWRQVGDKALCVPIMTTFIDSHLRHRSCVY